MIIVTDIAKDPYLKKEFRRLFETQGVVSVRPTDKGLYVVEERHRFYVSAHLLNSTS